MVSIENLRKCKKILLNDFQNNNNNNKKKFKYIFQINLLK